MQATQTAAVPKMTTKVQHVPHTGEWVVRVRIDGKRYPDGDYFTDDKADAKATEARMHADFLTLHPPAPLTVAIEGAITVALLGSLQSAARCRSVDDAAAALRAQLRGFFVYRGGSHVAVHADRDSPRLALITQ